MFNDDDGRLAGRLAESVSGRELAAAGYADDVVWATRHDVSKTVPRLVEGAYRGD